MSKNIDDLIDQWHNGDSELSLHEYLGMTVEEYEEWMKGNLKGCLQTSLEEIMDQVFECPQCHDSVRPGHLACYSCGLTAEKRPTVATREMQSQLLKTIESIRNAYSKIDEAKMNSHNHQHVMNMVNEGLTYIVEALHTAESLESSFL